MIPIKNGQMYKSTTPVNEDDPIKKITSLQARIDEIQKKKIESEKEIELLQKAYDEKVKELAEKYEITDVNNLEQIILNLEQELKMKMEKLESEITEVEGKIL